MNRPINPGRLILATIFAPYITVAVVTLIVLGSSIDFRVAPIVGTLKGLGHFTLIISAIIAWPAMLIMGLPLHSYLCHKTKRRWYYYALAGALAGSIAALVFSVIAEGTLAFGLLLLGLATGATAALLFHLMRGPHLALTEPPNAPT